MSAEPIPFGPFELIAPAGKGGMGEVWRGRHVAENVPVAIKLVGTELEGDPELRALFRHEVRMAASLDHPNVVLLFDQGEVTDATAQASGGRFRAGAPYLVMEWASEGTLASRAPVATWTDLEPFLLAILDALGHAHSRGVLHRDLKPGNVLVCGPGDLRPGLKLADFGAAFRGAASVSDDGEGDADLLLVAGTTSYMSPEQAERRFRDEGPWTDLFSFGVLAHRLATGQLPWVKPRASHAPFERIPFRPRTSGVPEGLEAWIGQLLAVDPRDRFVCAAEARNALGEIESAPSRPTSKLVPFRPTSEAVTLVRPGSVPPVAEVPAWRPDDPRRPMFEGGPRVGPPPRIDEAPPGDPPVRRPLLTGAGLGLYGLRPVPLVDRVPERRHLWRALAQTAVERRARLVVLRGPAGCGKSRLAAWLVERAHEGGHAIGLRALHGPIASAGDGAGPMLARHFGVSGAPLEAPIRLSAVLAELGIAPAEISAASDELLAWSEGRPGAAARPAAERWEIATRALTRLAARRPAVLWLDDVHWGAGTLALTQHLLDAQATAPAPILIVATVRDDALAERAVEGALLGALSERAEASTLALGALPEPDRGTLVRALLGLDAELAARVEERTAGNPAFTVELVADWTRRGLLVHGPSGFRLREGVSVGLPADLASTWTEILEHVLADRPPGDAIALEVAAAFGGVGVVPAEWARACETVSGTPSLDLLDVLASRGLVSRATPGAPFSLVHGMLREALEARAHAAGRARAQHHAWAVVLAGGAEGSVDRQEQLGRHLLAAGDAVGAALRLVPAIAGRVDAGEASRAYALAVDTESALGPAGPAETCEAARVLRADAARLLGRYEEAATLSEEIAAATSDARTRAHALLVRGVVARERGEPKVALAHWRDGLRIARSVPDPGRAAQLARWIGVALTDLGDLAGAEESFEEALRDAPEGDHGLRANVEIAHAAVLRLANRLPEAEQVLERARAHAERVGRGPMASALNALGELSRWRGRFEAAERHYEAAAALYDAVGSRSTAVARLNLGLTRIESGRPLEAETPLRSCLETARRQGRRGLVAMALGGLMAPAAARRDWTAWEETQHALVAEVAAIHLVEIDLARALARAAELATAAGEGLRALPVFELAIAQLAALGREDEAAPLRLVVDGLKSC